MHKATSLLFALALMGMSAPVDASPVDLDYALEDGTHTSFDPSASGTTMILPAGTEPRAEIQPIHLKFTQSLVPGLFELDASENPFDGLNSVIQLID